MASGLNPGTPSVKGIRAGIYIYIYTHIFLLAGCFFLLVDLGISAFGFLEILEP